MKRIFSPFVLTLTAIVVLVYAYVAWRLASGAAARAALALPFFMVWIVPVVYWAGERESTTVTDEVVHAASYVCMGWLNFLVLLTLLRDVLLLVSPARLALHVLLREQGPAIVIVGSFAALGAGLLLAVRGPHLKHVDVPFDQLDAALEGFTIVQISDLHVGPTIGERYVQRVVEMSNALAADLVVLTGDIVDGPPARLARHVAPLAALRARHEPVFVLGNHDCYSGAQAWIAHFQSLGMRVLLNEHMTLQRGGATLVLGGVVDPALRAYGGPGPKPSLAAARQTPAALRILLAHNPAIAAQAEEAGFDLQLSGHTHAGQFFPWTFAARLVHGPQVAGLSTLGRMHIYVSAGTGTWGPPVRFGSEPELTVLQLVRQHA